MHFEDVLRLLAILGTGLGAWRAWKAMPPAVRVNGRRYYRQADGGVYSAWGLRVRDPAVLAAVEQAAHAGRPS